MTSDGEVDREKKEKILVCESEVSARGEYRNNQRQFKPEHHGVIKRRGYRKFQK